MGKDISHRFDRKVRRRAPKSEDVYLRLLVKLYRFLARRTNSKFNKIIMKRLFMPRVHRPPLPCPRYLSWPTSPPAAGKIITVVGTVTDDNRFYEVPKMTAGGEVITFDVLARRSPLGKNTVLIQGRRKAREAYKMFGRAPGLPGSHTKPLVRSKGASSSVPVEEGPAVVTRNSFLINSYNLKLCFPCSMCISNQDCSTLVTRLGCTTLDS
ncbi:ribosomal protein L18 [Penaeus vannamei]|uniref:Large ribosomal subunit protein eL18 n=1 Tax=Penaeus vannamei TaxID=6689 RepID=A0A3R7PXA0_PENVA|nr:ribosomal protein L18 [Penaeus vannamei]